MLRRLRAFVSGRRLAVELDAELRFHIEMETEKYVAQGLSQDEARTRAWRNFGPVARHTEDTRDQRGVQAIEQLVQDVRYGVRVLVKHPGFAVLSILTLALGIGANTAIFSVIDAAYFARYPLREPERLLRVYNDDRERGATQITFSLPRYAFFREHQTSFDGFAAAQYNGIYGVVAQFAGQRRVEFGVRAALGARASEIVGLVMRQSLPPVAAGIVFGLAGAVLLARFVQTLLFGTSALEPALFAGASLSLALVATVAAAIPARRASRTSPIEAIRGS